MHTSGYSWCRQLIHVPEAKAGVTYTAPLLPWYRRICLLAGVFCHWSHSGAAVLVVVTAVYVSMLSSFYVV